METMALIKEGLLKFWPMFLFGMGLTYHAISLQLNVKHLERTTEQQQEDHRTLAAHVATIELDGTKGLHDHERIDDKRVEEIKSNMEKQTSELRAENKVTRDVQVSVLQSLAELKVGQQGLRDLLQEHMRQMEAARGSGK